MKKVMVYCVLGVCVVSFNASAGIVARYSFDVNGADISGNNNHSQLQAGSTIVVDAERGNVLDVQGGSGAYITGSYGTDTWIAQYLTQSNTVMCWFKMDAWGAAWAPALLWKGSDYLLSQRNTTATWRWTTRQTDGAAPQAIYASPNVADGTWHHIAAVTDTTNGYLRLYIDGVKVGWDGALTAPLLASAANTYIANGLVGRVDDMILVDEALDAAAIQSYMIPEPTTMLLLGVGAIAVVRRRRA